MKQKMEKKWKGRNREVEEDSQDQDRVYDKLIEQVNGRILKLEEYLEGVKENRLKQ